MKNHDEKYLEFVMHDKNLLFIGENEYEEFNDIFNSFKTFVTNDINSENFEHTDAILMQEQPNLILLNCSDDKEFTLKLIDEIYNYDEHIIIIIIVASRNFEKHLDTINKVDFVLTESFTRMDLYKKFLASFQDSTSVKATIKVDKEKTEDVEVFLDTFEGEILFLNEELKDCVTQFDNGELSHELLSDISDKMKEVSVVFSRHNYTKRVAPIFTQLSTYLETLDIKKIKVENIEGFTFLARIIDDIQTYLFEYFVSRIFVDVYVFEDSLKNSIKFMQNRLQSDDTSHDDSELNFF